MMGGRPACLASRTKDPVIPSGWWGVPSSRQNTGSNARSNCSSVARVTGLLSDRASLRFIVGAGPGPESSVAKLVGVRSRQDAASLVMTLLGEKAVLGDKVAKVAVHQQLLTRCLSIAGGTTQVLRNVVAERILGLPR